MYYALCGQLSARGDHSLSGCQRSDLAHDLSALSKDGGTACAVNCTVHPATAQKV